MIFLKRKPASFFEKKQAKVLETIQSLVSKIDVGEIVSVSKGYGGFTVTTPDGRCIKKVEAIKLDLIGTDMSYIDSTRRSYSSPYEITVCMTKEECKILLPFFQKAYKSVKSKYEKYNDIHNGGEATEREENLLMKYSEQLERLESVLSSIDEILK